MWRPHSGTVAVLLSLAVMLILPNHLLAQRIGAGGMRGYGGGRPGGHVVGRAEGRPRGYVVGARSGGYRGRVGGRAGALVRPGRLWVAPRAMRGPSATGSHHVIVRGGFRGGFSRAPLGLRRLSVPRHHLGFFGFPRRHFGFFFGSPFFGSPFFGSPFFGSPFFRSFPHHFGFFGFPPSPFGFFGAQTIVLGAPLAPVASFDSGSDSMDLSVDRPDTIVAGRDGRRSFEPRPALGRQLAVPATSRTTGDSLVVNRVSVRDVIPASALRLTWRNAGLEADQVVLFLADTAQATLVAQTLRAPPFTALFEPPRGTAFVGLSVTWPDGTTSTQVVPFEVQRRVE